MVSKFEIVAFCQNGILFFFLPKNTSEWERRDRRGAGGRGQFSLKRGGGQ